MTETDPVAVEELIEYVSTQLLAAASGATQAGREVIKLKQCKLSISYTVSRDQNGKLDLKVVGGSKGSAVTSTNSIELTFDPVGTITAARTSGDAPPIGEVEPIPEDER
jgi:hypothetical protein